jgi:hypothetical protein
MPKLGMGIIRIYSPYQLENRGRETIPKLVVLPRGNGHELRLTAQVDQFSFAIENRLLLLGFPFQLI